MLWLAHVYSHGLAESIERGHRLDRREFTVIARREVAIVPRPGRSPERPVLGAAGIFRESRAIWLALVIGLITLMVQGVRYARVEQLGRLATSRHSLQSTSPSGSSSSG